MTNHGQVLYQLAPPSRCISIDDVIIVPFLLFAKVNERIENRK